ncbi:MAG: hypothetical protein B7Z02_17340 [Rhodobacterales bacterium 32-67-9]|nr:MAG: hypothetical protein B7Z02_17340 [Rhodobacterales bacterium 32-67-9]
MTGAVARRLDAIHEKGALSFAELAELLQTSPETVSRWRQGHRDPRPASEKALLELDFFIDQLSELYDPREARLFLFSPQKLLNGQTPATLIAQGRMDEVHRLVSQIRDAVYL